MMPLILIQWLSVTDQKTEWVSHAYRVCVNYGGNRGYGGSRAKSVNYGRPKICKLRRQRGKICKLQRYLRNLQILPLYLCNLQIFYLCYLLLNIPMLIGLYIRSLNFLGKLHPMESKVHFWQKEFKIVYTYNSLCITFTQCIKCKTSIQWNIPHLNVTCTSPIVDLIKSNESIFLNLIHDLAKLIDHPSYPQFHINSFQLFMSKLYMLSALGD